MREMKNSGIAWIGEIPREWNISRIKYVADVDPSCDKTKIDGDSLITYTPMECIRRGNFVNKAAYLNSVSSSLTAYEEGDIVMAKVTPCFENGNIAIMTGLHNGFGLGSSELFVFRPRSIVTEYLFYWLQNYVFVQNAKATMTGTGGLKRVSPVFIKNCSIHMPPKEEQNKLVAFLDSKCTLVDTLIQNVQTQIEKLKAYKQSLITEVVTKGLDSTVPMKDSGVEWIGEIPEHWSVAALKYFTDILPGYAFSSNDFHTETGIALLRGVNVTPNGVRWEDTVYWNKEIADNLKPFILQHDDIVVGLDRPWISEGTRITRIKEKDLPSLLLQRVCRIRVKGFMDSRWVFLWIASNAFKESLSTETTGISVPHISTKQIGDFIVAIPPMEVQKEICEFIDAKCSQIDRLISIKQEKIEKLEQYKRSLIYEYVTGKKEVRL